MQIKTAVSYHLTPVRWLSAVNQQTTSAGEDMEKGDPRALWVGVQTGAATAESSVQVPPNI